MSSEPDEIRKVAVSPKRPHKTGYWTVERYGGRYLFLGPNSRMLFHSVRAKSWTIACAEARLKWEAMPLPKRSKWYGPSGIYAKMQKHQDDHSVSGDVEA